MIMRYIIFTPRICIFEGDRSGPCLIALDLSRATSKFETSPATVGEKGSLCLPGETGGASASYRDITLAGGRGGMGQMFSGKYLYTASNAPINDAGTSSLCSGNGASDSMSDTICSTSSPGG